MKCRMQMLSVSLIIIFLFAVFPANCEGYAWNCPDCGRMGNTGNYCGTCAHPAPWKEVSPAPLPTIRPLNIGDIITFGHYPQTAKGNDNTPIEWLVLEVQEDKALLISRYGLDGQRYHDEDARVSWEKCSMRAWLNGTFLDTAFTPAEQEEILTVDIDNSQEQSAIKGNDTQDKLFLLSIPEVNKLFGDDESRQCIPTDYAVVNWAYTSDKYMVDGRAAGPWWLRSSSDEKSCASVVLSNGRCDKYYLCSIYAVRPALWVDLKSGII